MRRNEWTALGMLAATFLGGAALASGSSEQLPWFISRAAGIGAFLALTASMILGLLVTTQAAEPRVPRAFSFEIHSFLSVLALTLVGIHGGALLFDSWFHFTPLDLLVPFMAPYAPLWTGLGVIAAWTMAVVTGSFWTKQRIGHRAWRKLHFASFVAYVLALGHGASAGTDTANPGIAAIYVVSAAAVLGLLTVRVAKRTARTGAKATGPRTVTASARRTAPRP